MSCHVVTLHYIIIYHIYHIHILCTYKYSIYINIVLFGCSSADHQWTQFWLYTWIVIPKDNNTLIFNTPNSAMMTSSDANIFRVTGPLCWEFTGHRWISLTKASDAEPWCFIWSAPWINGSVNNREAGDLRRHRAHYDVIVMAVLITDVIPPHLYPEQNSRHCVDNI